MNTHFLILLLCCSLSSISAFPHIFPNISGLPNITLPTSWDSFTNFSGCHLGQKRDGLAKIKLYFHQFGYLPDSLTNYTDDFDDSLAEALKTYQLNFNLNQTGFLDDSTLQQIVLPRCGVADVINGTSTMKSRIGSTSIHSVSSVMHYTFFPNQPSWPSWNRDLTYAFEPENQLTDTVKGVFRRAFDRWAAVTTLTFAETQLYNRADITIGFYEGNHGDGEPFDGYLGTLAHAFSPPDGRFHLDNAETWVAEGDISTSGVRGAIDLESVAVHEIGHILGLGHSSIEEAIMFPTISTGTRKVELASDDIAGIQYLYGQNPNYNASESPPSQERERSDGGIQFGAGNFKWGLVSLMGTLVLML